MRTSNFIKGIRLPLLGSMALLIQTGAALAADTGDVQMQVKAFLSGLETPDRATAVVVARSASTASSRGADPGEQARRFILGTRSHDEAITSMKEAVISRMNDQSNPHASQDAQAMVQRMLRGSVAS